MSARTIFLIAKQELVVSIRNKWTTIFAVVFGLLVLSISYFGTMTAGDIGFQGFNRTTASLLSLILYLIPLVALMMGTQSFIATSDDGEMLFAQPVSRGDILSGKILGLFGAITTSTLIGFGLGGMVIATQTDASDFLGYPIFVLLALVLALIFLSIAALVSVVSRRETKAFGLTLVVWFFFVIFYDLLVLGGSLLFRERSANIFIFASLFGDPVDIVRVTGLLALKGEEVFGVAGAALLKFLGGPTLSFTALLLGMILWAVVPFFIAKKLFERQDV